MTAPPAATDCWLVVYGGGCSPRVEVPAATLAEAEHLAAVSGGRIVFALPCAGRRRYRRRVGALAAGPGPAWPCSDHWHQADDGRADRKAA